MANILVLGGTGFVGRHLCEHLQRAGHRMTVPTRQLQRAAAIQHLPALTVVQSAIHQPQELARLVAGHDIVVNLVAILHGRPADFERVHVELVRSLIEACQAAGVRRLIHVSALGARADSPSHYQRTKAQAEALLAGSALEVTVLRPSVIFGAGDRFLNLFARLQRLVPIVPLAGADSRFQPVWVEDVARAIVYAIEQPHRTRGVTAEATGPDVFTLRQLVQKAGAAIGCQRPVIGLPTALGYWQAALMALLPGEPLLSADNLRAMQQPNVASPPEAGIPGLADWGIRPASLDAILPTYLHRRAGSLSPKERLVELRAHQRV